MFGKKKSTTKATSAAGSDTHLQIPLDTLDTKHPDASHEEEVFEALPQPVDFSSVKPTTRYQVRALARRALSYHRRQRITNLFCLVLWPILLVVVALLLAERGHTEGMVRYCATEVNPQTNFVFSVGDPYWADGDTEKHYKAAYYPVSNLQSYDPRPCVRWFGESYPAKAPYENNTQHSPHAYYVPEPDFNWMNRTAFYDEYRASRRVGGGMPYEIFKSANASMYYTVANDQIAQILGTRPKVTPHFFSEEWFFSLTNDTKPQQGSGGFMGGRPSYVPTPGPLLKDVIRQNDTRVPLPAELQGTGLFGQMPLRYADGRAEFLIPKGMYEEHTPFGFESYMPIHHFESKGYFSATPAFHLEKDVATMEKTIEKMTAREDNGPAISAGPPNFGGVSIEALELDGSASKKSVVMKAQMQMGTMSRYYGYGSALPSSGLRQMITMSYLTGAVVKTKTAGKYTISQGIRALPYDYKLSTTDGWSLSTTSKFLFPFALSFLLPTFVSILVQEKEDRHRMMMAMNGLKSGSYYLAHYVEFMTMQLILSAVFVIGFLALGSEFIWRTNPLVLIVLLVVWAHVQTTLAFFLGSMFSKTRKATLVIYFFVSISAIMTSLTFMIFEDGTPFGWYIHPTWGFFNIITTGIVQAAMINGYYPMRFVDFAVGTELFNCLMLLLGESFLFLILAFYIDAVAPSEYGVRRPWHFPITTWFNRASHNQQRDPESKLNTTSELPTELQDEFGGDADARAEADRVRTTYDPAVTPLIIDNLHHRYPNKVEPALGGISFGVETNTVLGLLGPNGAGKSTMIHLLTGLYEPTSGNAWVAGADIRTNMSVVHSKTGVCPQHDILWGDLTVADHLLFYSRLRGIPPSLEQQAVAYAIASVSLTKFRDRQVRGLSGGEKRRVSIAISLLGDNRVIFLDEPSTGLDPAVRRVIWDIINRVKVNRTVVLTTHSMEEADILSDRIAIMTAGRLRCIGSSLHLKELYGSGFRLSVTSKPGRLEEACKSIESKVLSGMQYKRTDKFTNSSVFDFKLSGKSVHTSGEMEEERGEMSLLFYQLSQVDEFPAVEDWGISQTTLEDVFIRIVTDADSSLAVPGIVQAPAS